MSNQTKPTRLLQIFCTNFALPFSATSLFGSIMALLFGLSTAPLSSAFLINTIITSSFLLISTLLYQHPAKRPLIVSILLFYFMTAACLVGLAEAISVPPDWHTPLLFITVLSGTVVILFGTSSKKTIPTFSSKLTTLSKTIPLSSIIFLGIFGLAVYLRFYQLGTLSFWVDETQSIIAAKNVLATGIPYHYDGFIYLRAFLYTLLNAGAIYLFGLSEFAVRLIPTIFSLLTLILIYHILKRISATWIALLGAFLFAASDFALLYARYNRFYVALAFLVTLHLYLYYRGFILGEKKYQAFAIIVACVMCGFDAKAIIFLPITLGFTLLYFYKDARLQQQSYLHTIRTFINNTRIFSYTILSTISFLIFNKIDTINTLSGESVKLYRPAAYEWNTPFPGFIEELLYPRLDFYFINFLHDHFVLLLIITLILTLTLLGTVLLKRTVLTLADFVVFYVVGSLLFLTKYAVNIEHYTWDQRHISFLFPLFIILAGIFIQALWRATPTLTGRCFVMAFIGILILHLIPPTGIKHVISMRYGQNLEDSRHLVMSAEPYRSDYKTPFQYVAKMYQPGDLILVSDFGGSRFADLYLPATIPYRAFDSESDTLPEQIQNAQEKRIWVIDITYDMEKHHAKFRWGISYTYLQGNQDKIVYVGNDQKTRVYLFAK